MEKFKSYLKYFLLLGIFIFIIIELLCNSIENFKNVELLDKVDYTVIVTITIATLYSSIFWKINPFESTPKIYGNYEATFISDYDYKSRKMKLIIYQNLFDTRIIIKTKESESISKVSKLYKEDDQWILNYIYINQPNAIERSHSDIHYGNCTINFTDMKNIKGKYFTDRKTSGDIKVKKLDK